MILCKFGIHRWRTSYEEFNDFESTCSCTSHQRPHDEGSLPLLYYKSFTKDEFTNIPEIFVRVHLQYQSHSQIYRKVRCCQWCYKKQEEFEESDFFIKQSHLLSSKLWRDVELNDQEIRNLKLEKLLS